MVEAFLLFEGDKIVLILKRNKVIKYIFSIISELLKMTRNIDEEVILPI